MPFLLIRPGCSRCERARAWFPAMAVLRIPRRLQPDTDPVLVKAKRAMGDIGAIIYPAILSDDMTELTQVLEGGERGRTYKRR